MQMYLNQPPTIDLDARDDDIQLLPSPGGFHQARNQSRRRNRSAIVVVEEEQETRPGPSGDLVNDLVIVSSHNHHNKRQRVSPTRTIVNCESCSISQDASSGKEMNLHKWTGHREFADKTMETANPIKLEAPKVADGNVAAVAGGDEGREQCLEMIVPIVDKSLLDQLESMGFPPARATRALHYSGNSSIEAAINWVAEHGDDADIDQMPLVPANDKKETTKPSLTLEEVKQKAQELREHARKKKQEEEEKRMEREREKRICIGKELLEAKRIEEENERKRIMALRKAEKEEEKRAREKIRQRLKEDKERIRIGKEIREAKRIEAENERKRIMTLRKAEKVREKRAREKIRQRLKEDKERIRIGKEIREAKRIEAENERKRIMTLRKAEKVKEKRAREKIRQRLKEDKERVRIGKVRLEAKRIKEENERKRIMALRKAEKEEEKRAREKIRQRLEEDKAEIRRKLGLPPVQEKKDDDAKVRRAFHTLLTYVLNVAGNPDEDKFRKMRLNNKTFQDRVGSLQAAARWQ